MKFNPRLYYFALTLLLLFVGKSAYDVWTFAQVDETRQADAAIVLGAAIFGDQPSPVLRERINHAIRLYEAGTVEMIIFTGGASVEGGLTESAVSRQYALNQGIPESAILIEEVSTDTRENLQETIKIAGDHQTFLIVSTPYHQLRAMKLAEAQRITAFSSPTRTTKWISWYTQSRAYFREVLAYIAFRLKLI